MTRFYQNDTEIVSMESVKFPITETGKSSNISILIENNSVVDNVELIFFSDDGDMGTDTPTIHLKPSESIQTKLIFSPAKDRPDSLRTNWGWREISG